MNKMYRVLQELFESKKLKFFTHGNYNINLFGIRKTNGDLNKFGDLICMAYKDRGEWVYKAFDATTSPSDSVLNEVYGGIGGTAILKSNTSYRFKLGRHKGQYPCLVQAEEFELYRDSDKDGKLSLDSKTETGQFGIQIHHASATGTSTQVDEWGHGCQVLASIVDWWKFIRAVTGSIMLFGSKVTYTIFDEADLGMCIHDFKFKMNGGK